MKKKILFIILCVSVVVSILTLQVSAFTYTSSSGEKYTFTIFENQKVYESSSLPFFENQEHYGIDTDFGVISFWDYFTNYTYREDYFIKNTITNTVYDDYMNIRFPVLSSGSISLNFSFKGFCDSSSSNSLPSKSYFLLAFDTAQRGAEILCGLDSEGCIYSSNQCSSASYINEGSPAVSQLESDYKVSSYSVNLTLNYETMIATFRICGTSGIHFNEFEQTVNMLSYLNESNVESGFITLRYQLNSGYSIPEGHRGIKFENTNIFRGYMVEASLSADKEQELMEWISHIEESENSKANNAGYELGYSDGYEDGGFAGWDKGYIDGSDAGYNTGYEAGKTDGYNLGNTDGYNTGYEAGHTDGKLQSDEEHAAIHEANSAKILELENSVDTLNSSIRDKNILIGELQATNIIDELFNGMFSGVKTLFDTVSGLSLGVGNWTVGSVFGIAISSVVIYFLIKLLFR